MPTPRPLPDLPGTYYSTIFGTAYSKPCNYTFSFLVTPAPATGSPDILMATACNSSLVTRWTTFANAALSQDYTATSVRTYALHSPTHPAIDTPFSGPGGIPGGTAPIMVGAVIRHAVQRRGKGSQTRNTITPLPSSYVDSPPTNITLSAQGGLTTHFNDFIAGVYTDLNAAGAAGVNHVVMSRGTGTAPGPVVAPATYIITSSGAELALSTQRRRAQRA